ncbi:hypothetical protein [Streptomyces antnestii]|nr:hypothetical protein [Streptomyces sp. San01]
MHRASSGGSRWLEAGGRWLGGKWPAGAGEVKGAYTDVLVYPTHNTK